MDYGTRKPRILILGAGFRNQGAFLMLVAASQQIRERFNGQPVIESRIGTQQQRDELGLQTMLGWQRMNFAPTGGGRATLRTLKNNLPFIFASDIDAVFDASGFAFSDQWIIGKHLERRSQYLKDWAIEKPTYLLPQALGPFIDSAEEGAVALNSASIVYARDPESYRHASELMTDLNTLRLAPDFTIGLKGPSRLHPGLKKFENGLAIVPNWNILKRATDDQARDSYIDGLVSAAQYGQEKGYAVYGLCHEGKNDYQILQMVGKKVGEFPIISGLNGLESKALIGTAQATVSGRFHAIVSALSQGIPTVIQGWSHKYQWLASDFGVEEFTSDPYDPKQPVENLERIEAKYQVVQKKILDARLPLVDSSEEMWKEIEIDLHSKFEN